MAHFPKEMKSLGYSVNEQQGDWLITWEVVGYNDKNKANVWAEKKRQFRPRPSIEAAMRGIEADQQYQRTKELHKITNRV